MALIFTSGGGRLGNQILNLIHLMALSFEYNIEVIKINDTFLTSKDKLFMFKVEKDIINWHISDNFAKNKLIYKLFLKILIRLIHLLCFFNPKHKSYKIGSKNNYPKFIVGKRLKKKNSVSKLIKESSSSNVALCGWGLRDWELVSKHKESILRNMTYAFGEYLDIKNNKNKDYLLVHIRRSDFLEVEEFRELNFPDEVWIKSIKKICSLKTIKKVVIFSDSLVNNFFISSLEKNGLRVLIPEKNNKNVNFLKLFFNYIHNGSYLICNASSLVLSIAFLSYEKIYMPSREKEFKEVSLDNAHKYSPTNLNWN